MNRQALLIYNKLDVYILYFSYFICHYFSHFRLEKIKAKQIEQLRVCARERDRESARAEALPSGRCH